MNVMALSVLPAPGTMSQTVILMLSTPFCAVKGLFSGESFPKNWPESHLKARVVLGFKNGELKEMETRNTSSECLRQTARTAINKATMQA